MRTRALSALLLAGCALAAQGAPPAYVAEYTFVRAGLSAGRALHRLSLDGHGGYRLEVSVEPTGIATLFTRERLSERSQGALVAGLPRPLRYEHRRSGGDDDRYRDFRLDPAAGRVVDRAGGIPPQPLPAGLQDDLSQLEHLRAALAAGRRTLELPVLYGGKGRVYEYRYAVGGEETVRVPAGRYAALRVTRTDSRGKYRYEMWCAPALNYLPVRIERYRNGRHQAGMRLVRYAAGA